MRADAVAQASTRADRGPTGCTAERKIGCLAVRLRVDGGGGADRGAARNVEPLDAARSAVVAAVAPTRQPERAGRDQAEVSSSAWQNPGYGTVVHGRPVG